MSNKVVLTPSAPLDLNTTYYVNLESGAIAFNTSNAVNDAQNKVAVFTTTEVAAPSGNTGATDATGGTGSSGGTGGAGE